MGGTTEVTMVIRTSARDLTGEDAHSEPIVNLIIIALIVSSQDMESTIAENLQRTTKETKTIKMAATVNRTTILTTQTNNYFCLIF